MDTTTLPWTATASIETVTLGLVNETDDDPSGEGSGPLVSVIGQTVIYSITALLTVLSNALNLIVLHRVPNCFDEVTQMILKVSILQ